MFGVPVGKCSSLTCRTLQDALESRHSVFHTAVTFMNALANAGTTSDQFLRDKDNFQWLGRASNWAMFSATAALGVIHKGSVAHAMTILAPYLPAEDGTTRPGGSVYSEGGSLFALGLAHARHGQEVTGYLTQRLKTHQDEVVQHGAALGLGMAGMATNNEGEWDWEEPPASSRTQADHRGTDQTSMTRSATFCSKIRRSQEKHLAMRWVSSCSVPARKKRSTRCCNMRTRRSTKRLSAVSRWVSLSSCMAAQSWRTA